MKYGLDFTVEPLKKRTYRHGRRVKRFYSNKSVMEKPKQFKNPAEIREYWRIHKRAQRKNEMKRKRALNNQKILIA